MDKALSPIHPGEVLLEDFMKPLKLSQYCLVQDIGIPPLRINQNVHGECSITAESTSLLTRRLQQDLAYDSDQ